MWKQKQLGQFLLLEDTLDRIVPEKLDDVWTPLPTD